MYDLALFMPMTAKQSNIQMQIQKAGWVSFL
jgi:hypothetical protein